MIEESDQTATVYEYRGRGATGAIVSAAKKHHADTHGVDYEGLTARKIARCGRWLPKTIVVVVEGYV